MSDTCRYCHKPVKWVVVAKTRERMPLDPERTDLGNVVYPWGYNRDERIELAYVERKETLEFMRGKGLLWMPHAATCSVLARSRETKRKAS